MSAIIFVIISLFIVDIVLVLCNTEARKLLNEVQHGYDGHKNVL